VVACGWPTAGYDGATMTENLHIDEQWRDALAAAGLADFDALMDWDDSKCLSWHDRGQVYRIELPDGRAAFLKRDAFTSAKWILTDLCHLRRPTEPCLHEMAMLRRVAAIGVPAPAVVAWGQRRRCGLPHRSVLVMTPLAGTPLHKLLRAGADEPTRRAAMQAAGRAAAMIYRAGLSWLDLVAKHFFVTLDSDDEIAGVLDLTRMRPTRSQPASYMPKQVAKFAASLRDFGGSGADLAVFLDALGYADVLDRSALLASMEA